MKLKGNDKIMVVGFTGSGKTHLTRHLIDLYLSQGIDVLVYDSEKEKHYDDLDDSIRYRPLTGSKEEFDNKCREVYRRRNVVFAIESLDLYANPYKPLNEHLPYLWRLVHWGRKRNIGLIMTSRRIASVHKDPCSQCKHWFIFYTFLPNDIDYMKKFVGETALKAKELQPWYFIYWSYGRAKLYAPIGGK